MAAPQQFTSAESTGVTLFYTPPPKDVPNIFAEWVSGYLMTATPWTRQVFNQRLAALDPDAQYKTLERAQRLKADMLNREAEIERQAAQIAATDKGNKYALEIARIRAAASVEVSRRGAESRMYVADVGQETALAEKGALSDEGEDILKRTQSRAQNAARGLQQAADSAQARGIEDPEDDPEFQQAVETWDEVFGNYRDERRNLKPVERASLDQRIKAEVLDAMSIPSASTRAKLTGRAAINPTDYGEAAEGPTPTPRREGGAPRQYRREPGQMGGRDPGGLDAPGPQKQPGVRPPPGRTSRARAIGAELRGESMRQVSPGRPSPAGGATPPAPPAAGAARRPAGPPKEQPAFIDAVKRTPNTDADTEPDRPSITSRLQGMQAEVDRDSRAWAAERKADPFGALGDFNDRLPTKESLSGDYRPDLSKLNDRQFERLGRWIEKARAKNPTAPSQMRDPYPQAADPRVRKPADIENTATPGPERPAAPAPKTGGTRKPAPASPIPENESLDDMLARLMPPQNEQDPKESAEPRTSEYIPELDAVSEQEPGESAVDPAESNRYAKQYPAPKSGARGGPTQAPSRPGDNLRQLGASAVRAAGTAATALGRTASAGQPASRIAESMKSDTAKADPYSTMVAAREASRGAAEQSNAKNEGKLDAPSAMAAARQASKLGADQQNAGKTDPQSPEAMLERVRKSRDLSGLKEPPYQESRYEDDEPGESENENLEPGESETETLDERVARLGAEKAKEDQRRKQANAGSPR